MYRLCHLSPTWPRASYLTSLSLNSLCCEVPISAVVQNHVKAADIRRDYICSLGVTLSALGMAGNKLIKSNPSNWEEAIKVLSKLDWNKKSETWAGLVVVNDKVVSSKTTEAALARYFEKLFLDRS